MNVSKYNAVNILDLPDEILEFIVNKLKTIDLCYSLVDVNQRFDRLVLHSRCIHHLDFAIESITNRHSSMCIDILNRICEEILPRIHQKITKLTLEPFSIERVIGTVDYPQLYSLSFVNFQPEILFQHLTDETMLPILTNQITHMMVDIELGKRKISPTDQSDLFQFILLHCTRLNELIFFEKFWDEYLTLSSLIIQNRNYLSSTVTKLTIYVNTFNDCLYLLNGCFQSLSTLIVRISENTCRSLTVENTKKLLRLKCFSLSTDNCTFDYDKFYVPLLQRMLNLEELILFLCVMRTGRRTYIDSDQLDEEILKYMPRLKKFIFSIYTRVSLGLKKQLDLQSTDHIRNGFIKKGIQSIGACSDSTFVYKREIQSINACFNRLFECKTANCHVYSLPYQFNEFLYMNKSFQGGNFDKVRSILIQDIRPFEHELFRIMSRSFPFLEKLTIYNEEAQENEQEKPLILITFNHLYELDLSYTHSDYVRQFLSENNTRLPCLTNLAIKYQYLATLTNHFTNDVARLNCSKITSLKIYTQFDRTESFHSYFPSLCKS